VGDEVVEAYQSALRRWHRTPFNSGYPEQLVNAARLMRGGAAPKTKESEIVHDPLPGLG
jgi:hypothetical protein